MVCACLTTTRSDHDAARSVAAIGDWKGNDFGVRCAARTPRAIALAASNGERLPLSALGATTTRTGSAT